MTEATIVYHKGCMDGFCAAWIARTALLKEGVVANYVAAHYSDEAPDVTGHDVYVLDFTYPREALLKMKEQANSIVVLDHHKSAREDLEGLGDWVQFDMERSGAGLTWDFFHPGEPRPWFVSYIEDRDIWRWALPKSKEVNAYLFLELTFKFDVWDHVAEYDTLKEAIVLGDVLIQHQDRQLDIICGKAFDVRIDGMKVPVVNNAILISEAGHRLAKKAPFSIGWQQVAPTRYVYNLRSAGDFDVSVFAKRFGGGGHAGAAGFTSTMPFMEWLFTLDQEGQ